MITNLYRLVRHYANGGRAVVAEPLEFTTTEVEALNKAFCAAGTMFRVWGIRPEAKK